MLGGNDGNTRKAINATKPGFIIFAVSDAISLFTSAISLLLSLSILTARYREEDKAWILIPIGLLTCLPIASFMTLLLLLLVDLLSSTYGHGIFGKKQ